jgi:hypothetical protein
VILKEQIIKIHALLPKHVKYDKDLKADFIASFTGSADKTSTKDLTFEQANQVITYLGGSAVVPASMASYAKFDNSIKTHRTLLSVCFDLGWVEFNQNLKRNVADLHKLGSWLKSTGYLHKPLMEYTTAELPKLVNQFQNVLNNSK